jgi:hypothetical protein
MDKTEEEEEHSDKEKTAAMSVRKINVSAAVGMIPYAVWPLPFCTA